MTMIGQTQLDRQTKENDRRLTSALQRRVFCRASSANKKKMTGDLHRPYGAVFFCRAPSTNRKKITKDLHQTDRTMFHRDYVAKPAILKHSAETLPQRSRPAALSAGRDRATATVVAAAAALLASVWTISGDALARRHRGLGGQPIHEHHKRRAFVGRQASEKMK
jgi:hypothetical protein